MPKWFRRLIKMAAIACAIMAVAQEMQKPREERTWNGMVLGFVPYDFRMPTAERVRAAFWNPEDPRILTPHAFGVGWAVNIPSAVRWLHAAVHQFRQACGC